MSDEDAFAGERSAPSDRSPLGDPPVRMEWTLETCGPVALVSVRLDNRTASPQPIRLSNRLAGPTLPPRRHGVPEVGWDEEGFSGTVPSGGGLALGYACPLAGTVDDGGPPNGERDPVDLSVRPPDEVEPDPPDAAAVVRDLGAARPPRDAVPVGSPGDKRGSEPSGERRSPLKRSRSLGADGGTTDPETADDPGPPTTWLDRVEARIERAERLDGASLGTATATLRDRGGLDALGGELRQVRRDAGALEELAERASTLAARADAVDAPVEALERLA